MRKLILSGIAVLLFFPALAHADFVILRDGRSYSGTFTGAPGGKIGFEDNSGIQYTFPAHDVQTVVFSNLTDHIALRSGQSYTGHLTGITRISFAGSNGISYVFPLKDVSSLVISTATTASSNPPPPPTGNGASAQLLQRTHATPVPAASNARVLSIVVPSGTAITVRTNDPIDTTKDQVGKLYSASIQGDVVDSTGNVGIPTGTPAQLQVVTLNQGTTSSSRDLALDLYSVSINGKQYRVDSSSVAETGSADFGMNKRTAEYSGGGAALGALLGAVFGGGRGAGIGTLVGAGAGAVTQYATRGREVKVPAESVLHFQVQQTLVLHP